MFMKFNGLSWEKPRCVVTAKLPFIPTEQEIDALISASGKKLSTFLLLLKETAMRRGEAKRLQWTNVDNERNIITLNAPEKHSNPRMWKVAPRLISMLNALQKNSQMVFGNSKIDSMKSMFLNLRKKLAIKLQNPRLKEIKFLSFRYWKGTMIYHQTKNILLVKKLLGHKRIENTMKYAQLIHFKEDEYDVATSITIEEDQELLKTEFEYVTERKGIKSYRRPKIHAKYNV